MARRSGAADPTADGAGWWEAGRGSCGGDPIIAAYETYILRGRGLEAVLPIRHWLFTIRAQFCRPQFRPGIKAKPNGRLTRCSVSGGRAAPGHGLQASLRGHCSTALTPTHPPAGSPVGVNGLRHRFCPARVTLTAASAVSGALRMSGRCQSSLVMREELNAAPPRGAPGGTWRRTAQRRRRDSSREPAGEMGGRPNSRAPRASLPLHSKPYTPKQITLLPSAFQVLSLSGWRVVTC